MCGNLNKIFKLIMKLVNMKTMKQQENIDHFHKCIEKNFKLAAFYEKCLQRVAINHGKHGTQKCSST